VLDSEEMFQFLLHGTDPLGLTQPQI
jgi:hypothetical protein